MWREKAKFSSGADSALIHILFPNRGATSLNLQKKGAAYLVINNDHYCKIRWTESFSH